MRVKLLSLLGSVSRINLQLSSNADNQTDVPFQATFFDHFGYPTTTERGYNLRVSSPDNFFVPVTVDCNDNTHNMECKDKLQLNVPGAKFQRQQEGKRPTFTAQVRVDLLDQKQARLAS